MRPVSAGLFIFRITGGWGVFEEFIKFVWLLEIFFNFIFFVFRLRVIFIFIFFSILS